MKKVVVISTSLRPGSNSHTLAEQFAEGAESAGNEVELISLKWKEIKFCIGCLSCQKTGACVFKDDVLLTTAAESEEDTPKRAESGLQGWIDCYEKSALKAHLFCGGVNDSREINGNPKLQEAFELGKIV